MRAERLTLYLIAIFVTLIFLYPFWWMVMGAMRSTEAVMTSPLRLWPEQWSLRVLSDIASIGGQPLWRYALNSAVITGASTMLSIAVTALGAYAIVRAKGSALFETLRYTFLVSIMYPYMLLVIPVYIVMYQLGLLGSYTGMILFLALGPIQFFLFEQFFRTIPAEVIEAAMIDGASEWTLLWQIVMPMAAPVVATATIITFLLNWAQWFPVMVISRSPDTFTLPVALLNLNGELGVNVQGIMALAVLTTLPTTLVFLAAQKRVMSGMADGAVKG